MAKDSSIVWTYLVFYAKLYFFALFSGLKGFQTQSVSQLLFRLGPRNLAVDSSNYRTNLVFMNQQLYDPSLEIFSIGGFFRILWVMVGEGLRAQLGQGTAEVHLA